MLPQALDVLAESEPERTLGCIAKSTDMSKGFIEVKTRDIARAVNYCAWWLEEQIGRGADFETIGILEIADFRYTILFLAVVKLGYKLLAPSPRNTWEMNWSLLQQTDCRKILVPSETDAALSKLPRERAGLLLMGIPSFNELIEKESKPYPFDKTWGQGKWDPVLVLHSSGSTGPPKPIVLNHGAFSCLDNERNLHPVQGRRIQSTALFNFPGGGYYYSSPLPSHLSGFLSMVEIPIFSTSATVVLGPAGATPSGKILSETMKHYPIRGTFAAPNIVEELVLEPNGLEQASKLDFILFMGGPLSTAIGDQLSQKVTLCQFYGSTELLEIATLIPASKDWAYVEFHPTVEADLQQVEDNICELVFHQNKTERPRLGLDWTYPDVEHWHTKDLFKQHPTKSNLWQFYGRTDDLVVLATAAKFHPVSSEIIISGSPLLRGALMAGQGRSQAALLIEPKLGVDRASLVEKVWPVVEHANERATTAAQIDRSKIIVTSSDKPFQRTEKGTIIRKASLELYAMEIDQLYGADATPSSSA